MLDAKLVIVGGANVEQQFDLALPATLGRSSENDIPLAHPLVSRRHCELFESQGQLFVRDLGSLNGTYVGNQPTEGATPIAAGQLLTVGTVTFRAVYGGYDLESADDDVLAENETLASLQSSADSQASLTMAQPAHQQARPLGSAMPDTKAGIADETASSNLDTEPMPPRNHRPRKSR